MHRNILPVPTDSVSRTGLSAGPSDDRERAEGAGFWTEPGEVSWTPFNLMSACNEAFSDIWRDAKLKG